MSLQKLTKVLEELVKSLDMINKNAEGLNKLAGFLKDMQDNQNLMATKILELEKKLEVYEQRNNN